MSLWTRLVGRSSRVKSSSLDLFREIYGGRESSAGPTVNWGTALEVSAVLAVCRVIANGISQVPWRVYQQTGNRRAVAAGHPLNRLLTGMPNPWQTSFEFRETIAFHVLLTGNAFIFANRVGVAREVKELIPIEPGRVEVRMLSDRRLEYRVRGETGAVQVFSQEAIWQLRGTSWNSWLGLDAVRMARDAIGLAMALERGHAEFHKNGAKTSGLYSVEDKLSPEKYEMLRQWFAEELTKLGGYRPLILDQGAKYTPFTMTGVDAQHLETRKFQIEEICREFGVLPIMVGVSGSTDSYASAEQKFIAHVVHTLSPWFARIEQSADANLLTAREIEEGYYTKFTPNALMRGAAADRANFYAQALGSGSKKGWMSQNDIRALEELDRVEDPEADMLQQPVVKETPAHPSQETPT